MCARERLAFIPWEPVIDSDDATLGPIAKAHGASVHQVTLAWLLARSPCVLPIPGTGMEFTQTGRSSSVMLDWHVEDGFREDRCDYVSLICLRGDPAAASQYAQRKTSSFHLL